jgi:hypothetical protein
MEDARDRTGDDAGNSFKAMHILVLLFTLTGGCLSAEQTIQAGANPSPDGVNNADMTIPRDDAGDCAFKNAQGEEDFVSGLRCRLRKRPDETLCTSLPKGGAWGKDACLSELAAMLNDTAPCRSLQGHKKTICEAEAVKDAGLCDRIPPTELKLECRQNVERLTPPGTQIENCSGLEAEERTWCIVYSARATEDCLQIDDAGYPDEAAYCRAKTREDPGQCAGIGDVVLSNLCRRAAQGLV